MTSTPGGSGGTPWWERKEAELREKSSAADDATCSISSSETYSCRTAPDENGVMRRKCERTVRKFRMCPGRAPEEIECTREETDDENVRGGGSSSTTTTSSFETEFFKTFGAEMGSGGMPPLPFPFGAILGGAHNFPFGGDGGAIKGGGDYTASGGGGGGGGGSVFGPMAAMAGIFKAFYDFAQEMERMELEEERRMVERSRQADRPSSESAAGGGVLDSFFRRGRGGGGGGGGSVDGNEKPSRDGER